jgi:hypothetical protein
MSAQKSPKLLQPLDQFTVVLYLPFKVLTSELKRQTTQLNLALTVELEVSNASFKKSVQQKSSAESTRT